MVKLLIDINDERMTLDMFKLWVKEAMKEIGFKRLVGREPEEIGKYVLGIVQTINKSKITEVV